uniref:Hexosyltransferase n=1 Tax=Phallusia mammillata TaxID=59560 RepID=A0A6F9D7V6_9ASCI|nr:beta-1,3-galactosyltransferase 5-like [Phallusia mammillata]
MLKVRHKFKIRHDGDKRSKLSSFSRRSHTFFIIIVVLGSLLTYMMSRALREEQNRSVELYMRIRDGVVVLDNTLEKETAQESLHEENVVRTQMDSVTSPSAKANPNNNTFGFCKQNSSPYLLAIVFSKDEASSLRGVIRDTWCKRKDFSNGRKMACVFAIGENLETKRYEQLVKEEGLHHNDIIKVPATDDVRNSTLKLMNVFHQVTSQCKSVRYILRTEDDVIINMEKLMDEILPTKPETKYAGGRCMEKMKPHRNEHSNFYVSVEEFSQEFYPPICYGMGYLLSGDLMHAIFSTGLRHQLLPLDDVFIGVTLDRLHVKPKNLDNFLHVKSIRGATSSSNDAVCKNVIVHVHINTVENVRKWWQMMRDVCSKV